MKRSVIALFLLMFFQFCLQTVEARDFYWIGGSGNFNDIQHWSDQPGGKVNPNALLPDKDDNVYFNEHSFPAPGAEVVITNVARCANMYWGNVKNMPTLKTDNNPAHYLVVYGGVKFNDKMILDLDRPLYFRASTLGNEIDFGGNIFTGDFYFENNGGWRITTDLNLMDNDIHLQQGTLSVEANLTCGRIISENPVSRELYLNSSTINLQENNTSVLRFNTENLNVVPGNSKIVVSGTNSSIETTGSKRVEFYDVDFLEENAAIVTEGILATFNKVEFKKNGSLKGQNDYQELGFTEGQTYLIYSGGVQNVLARFQALGQCSAYISIEGESSGSTISANLVDLDYLKVKNITASGTAANFNAPNSYNLGGNLNWNFTPPSSDTYTWTGAIDNNWGVPGNWDKLCVPSRNNDVVIPGTSIVTIDVPSECKSFNSSDNSTINGAEDLQIFGSLNAGNATWNFTGTTTFMGDLNNTISITNPFQGAVRFDGDGSWSLATGLSTNNNLELISGTFQTNGNNVSTKQFISTSSYMRTLDITNSQFSITGGVSKAWQIEGTNFSLNKINSTIILTQSGAGFYSNTTEYIQYGTVQFNPLDGQVFLTNEGTADPEFQSLKFNGNAKITGNHQFQNISFNQGKEYLFTVGSEQKILTKDGLEAIGTCSEYISFKGDGGIAFFDCGEVSDNIVRVRIENVNVKGGLITSGGKLEAKESIGVAGYEGWSFPNDLPGTTIYWTGQVDDDWFTAQNWSTACIPTRKDDVIFDESQVVNSLNVNINNQGSVAECKNMTWSNANLMKFSGDESLFVFGSLDFTGMQAANFTFSGDVYLKSESAETVKTEPVELLGNLIFEGNQQEDKTWIAGTWTLQTSLKTTESIVLKNGDVISGGNAIEGREFLSNFGVINTRSMDLGSSVVSLERFEITPEALTFTAGTSEIKFVSGGNLIVSGGTDPVQFYNVSFEDANTNAYLDLFADNVSFNNMSFKGNTFFRKVNTSKIGFTAENIQLAVGKTYEFESDQTYVLGNIDATGACEGTIDITGSGSKEAIFQAKAGVSKISVSRVNILNVKAQPAGVFEAQASISLGNTDGWTFVNEPAGTNLYWVGGTGYWDDPNHWSTTSGGSPNGCVPTAKDNVFFDDGSFTDTEQIVYTGASDIRCRTMDWTGSEAARPHFQMGNIDITGVYIYGSLIFNSSVDVDLSPMLNFYFRATEAQQIHPFGYNFPNIVEFDGKGGIWTLQDDLLIEGDCFIKYGKLVTNGNYLECKSISSTQATNGISSRGLDIRNSQVKITGKEDMLGRSVYFDLSDAFFDQGFEFLADNSTITFTDNAEVFIQGIPAHNIGFNELIFEKDGKLNSGFSGIIPYTSHLKFKGNGVVSGKNKFGILELGRGFEFKLAKGETYEMDDLVAEGSCFAPIYIHSSRSGDQTNIKAANNVIANFLELKDIKAEGSSTYTATNSFIISNVDGWTVDGAIAPIDLYWVGKGSDDSWHNHENWSRSADGSEEGCVPTLNDNVIFDENSFLGSKLVEILSEARCHNITWTDGVDPAATWKVKDQLKIGGFMDLTETMTLDMQGSFNFVGDGQNGDKLVDFANKSMDGDIIFNGENQSWIWQTGFVSSGDLSLEAGSIATQGNDFTLNRFNSLALVNGNAARKFNMDKSLVTITSSDPKGWSIDFTRPGGFDFTSTNTKITFTNGGELYCKTDVDVNFGFVDFIDNGILRIDGNGEGKFGSVRFLEQGQVFGDNTFTNLEFTLGYEHNSIESGKVVTVENDLRMEGVRCSYVFLKASKPGQKAFLHKPSGEFSKIYNASLTDIQGSSGSGLDHPVHYKYENNSSFGFYEKKDPGGEDNPPSFEDSFDQPREEWCSNVAVLDHVERFPINNSTTFQWYYSIDGIAGTYNTLKGETNAVIQVDKSGFYKVDVNYGLDNNGVLCIIESVIEVRLGTVSNVSLEITANNVKCFGEGNGRVVAKVKNGIYPEYQFFWKDESGANIVATTNKITWESTALGLNPGKYYITVADGKNCEYSTEVSIFDAYELLIDDIATKNLSCFHKPEGEIAITASGGTGALSYYLDDALQPGASITGLFSGDYIVYVQDENSCKTNEEAVLLTSNPEIKFDWKSAGLLCYNDKDGEINPNVSGGVPSYQYQWTGPNGFTSTDPVLQDRSGGKYKLTVTDKENCDFSGEFDLKEPEQLTTNELVVEPTVCNGENTGEIFVEAKQGTPGYRYFLDNVESASGIFKDLQAKEYGLRIVDANGCMYNQNVEVTEPGKVGFLVQDIVLPSCEKINDGIIHIKPYGGNGGYSFSWSGPDDYRSYSQDIEGLVSGTYSLLIQDNKNCSSENEVDLDLGLPLQLGLVVEQHLTTANANNGELAIEIIEGTTPYTFTVSGPGGYTHSSPANFDDHNYLIKNLAAGVYKVVVTDDSGCTTIEKSVIIEEPDNVFAFIKQVQPVGCVGNTDGELTANARGGDGTYTYSWTGPAGYTASGKTASGLAPGTYNVAVNSAGRTANASFELLPANPLLVSIKEVNNVSCYQAADGEIEVSVDAGTADYTIEWTGVDGFLSAAKRVLDLEPGTYNYKVTTQYGCTVSGSQDITEPTDRSLAVSTTDITYEGGRDGTLSATVTGGTPPYTLLVSGPNGYSYASVDNASGTIFVDKLEMGVYEVVGLDANGCRIEDEKKVHEPKKLLLFVTKNTNVTCPGGNDGAVEVDVLGHSADENLSFSWTGDNYFRSNSKNVSGLKAGNYTVTVYDSKGDPGYEKQSLIVTVREPDRVEAEYWKKDISCPGMNDGYINLHPQGGTPGYTCLWTGNVSNVTFEDQAGLTPGTYTIEITDSKGCKSDKVSIEINEPKPIATVSSLQEPICYGEENGWINLDITNGTAPYIINWDNYGSVTQNIKELEKGVYQYTVFDDNGCSTSDVVTLNQPDTLIAEINTYQDVLCYGQQSGRALVDIQGGTPAYNIQWSDGQNTQEAIGLRIGAYDVKVTDDHGCTDISSVELNQPEPLDMKVEVIRPSTVDSRDGAIHLDIVGGIKNYTITWDPILPNDLYVENLERGTYHVTISDANQCEIDSLIVLEYLYENRIKIPKGFTPNNDGYNDYWDIERIEYVQNVKIVIYDRWGKAVFKFSGTGNQYKGAPWTGVDGKSPLPIGSYYYAVEVDDEKPRIGTVTILR